MPPLDVLAEEHLFICPRCASQVQVQENVWRCASPSCPYSGQPFPVLSGIPALVDFERSVLDADRLQAVQGASDVRRPLYSRVVRRIIHPANTTAPVKIAHMLTLLRAEAATTGRRPRVLVIGGGTVGDGLAELYADPLVDLISFDIYASPTVQFIGDGHAVPLADGVIDGVIVQAVLEHVLEPELVAREIYRVLRSGGIVYADTPFMQQVHEGAYDFTRFTESGHRYLFRSFERIDSGLVAGAGTALRWSIDYFVRALTRSVRAGRIMSLCFFWLSYLDRILDPRHSLDGASSVFFLGRKTAVSVTETEIIDHYQGAIGIR